MNEPAPPRQTDPERARQVAEFCTQFEAVVANIGKIIKGKDDVVRRVLLAMVARGHVLLLDVPGTGKTLLARSIAASVHCDFKRIQYTPDLLPMDITPAVHLWAAKRPSGSARRHWPDSSVLGVGAATHSATRTFLVLRRPWV